MSNLILVPPAQWEIRQAGILGLVGTEHITITLHLDSASPYWVFYQGNLVMGGKHETLAAAQEHGMTLPALLLDFGMDA